MKDGARAGGGGSRAASRVGARSEPLAGGSIAVGGKKLAASTAAEPLDGEPRQLQNHAEGRRGSPAGSAWQLGGALEEAPAATEEQTATASWDRSRRRIFHGPDRDLLCAPSKKLHWVFSRLLVFPSVTVGKCERQVRPPLGHYKY